MRSAWAVLLIALFFPLLGHVARAEDSDPPEQESAPPAMTPAAAAQKRFPQPVVVETLLGRTVLEPLESQPVLGHVEQIVRQGDGIKVVINYGGFLGFGSRPIAVPVEAMVLLGQYMEVVDFKPDQLDKFPTFAEDGAVPLAKGDTIKVGLARPSH
jgi:hypothetical protein